MNILAAIKWEERKLEKVPISRAGLSVACSVSLRFGNHSNE